MDCWKFKYKRGLLSILYCSKLQSNLRENTDRNSCGEKGFEIRTALIKELTLYPNENIKVRVNKSGCLNECRFGPAIVIYPEGFWYYNVSLSDVSEIIKRSVIGNKYIKRLSRK